MDAWKKTTKCCLEGCCCSLLLALSLEKTSALYFVDKHNTPTHVHSCACIHTCTHSHTHMHARTHTLTLTLFRPPPPPPPAPPKILSTDVMFCACIAVCGVSRQWCHCAAFSLPACCFVCVTVVSVIPTPGICACLVVAEGPCCKESALRVNCLVG